MISEKGVTHPSLHGEGRGGGVTPHSVNFGYLNQSSESLNLDLKKSLIYRSTQTTWTSNLNLTTQRPRVRQFCVDIAHSSIWRNIDA